MKTEFRYILHLEKVGFISIVNTHRAGLIDDAEKNYGSKWKKLQGQGYSVVKVLIKPISRKKK